MTLEVVQGIVQEMAQGETVQGVLREMVQGVLQEIAQQEVEKHQQDCSVGWRMSRVSDEATRGAITDIQFQNVFYESGTCRTYPTSLEP